MSGAAPTRLCPDPTPYDGWIGVSFPDYTAEGTDVTFTAGVDFTTLDLPSRQMVELTPILRSTRTSYEKRFAPVVICGRQRARIIERAERFGDGTWAVQPAEVIVLTGKTDLHTEVSVNVPFEKWMRHSELVLVETTTACRNLPQEYAAGITSKAHARQTPYVFPAPYRPVYEIGYLEPEVEPVKTLSETYSAQLQFRSGRSDLVESLGNNAAVLNEANAVIGKLKADTLLTIRRIFIKGYSSPEGSVSGNLALSRARAQALVDYMLVRHNYRAADGVITSVGMGEDWDGLRKLVAESDLADRHAILSAIDNNADDNRKEAAVKNISGGRAWRTLLADYFPQLRRNGYTLEYEVRGFNAREAETLIRTRPQLLSLNEMFLVSRLYDPASREYKEVFDIILKMYPESSVAQFNTGVMELENGDYDSAISRLQHVETPESWNNLGVAYWHTGNYERSADYFRLAADAGLGIARKNLQQYNLWFEDKD